MKFKLHDVKYSFGRLGYLTGVERLPSFHLETPNILFYTRAGCVPNLTYDVIEFLTDASLLLQIPLASTHVMVDGVESFNQGLNSFIGAEHHLSYFIIQDPLKTVLCNQLRSGAVAMLTKHSKQFLSKETFMDIVEKFNPDVYVSLSDGFTNMFSGTKRTVNSFNTTISAIQYCIDRHFSSETLKNKGFIAPIVGGFQEDVRERCAKLMASYPVLGYSIDGLFKDSREVFQIPVGTLENIVSSTLSHLPDNCLRVLHGPWSPKIILKMIKLGIDLFDTTFPVMAAESGFALTFDFNVDNLFDDNIMSADSCDIGINEPKENLPLTHDDLFNSSCFKKELLLNPFVTNLHDTKFREDFSPVFSGCDCICCQKHTKSYLYHLIETKELLATVLLTLHNLHHYVRFFEKIRETIKHSNQVFSETQTYEGYIQSRLTSRNI